MFIALFLSTALANDTTPDPADSTDPTQQTTGLSGPALTWYMEQAEEKPACPAPPPPVAKKRHKRVVASTPAPVPDPVLPPVANPDPSPPAPVTPVVSAPIVTSDGEDFAKDLEELDRFRFDDDASEK
jgi:hypothetical protein